MSDFSITALHKSDRQSFIHFSDEFIGQNYFNENNFDQQIHLSTLNHLCCSFVLKNIKKQLIGIRITYAPSLWDSFIDFAFLKDTNGVAYFKSLFVDPKYQKKGLGPMLSRKSIEILKQMGAKKILTHSWKESPNNSSVKYLESAGFKSLGDIKNYWEKFDYLCSGCQIKPCQCTAVEMIYNIR